MILLLILCACADTREENPPFAETDGNGVTVTASFQQEDGTALCGSAVQLSREDDSVVCPLDDSGETRFSGVPRDNTFTLSVLNQFKQPQGTILLTFTEGAVIDAVTDQNGNGHVTLRRDTAEISLVFLLKGDGTIQCGLRLEQTEPSGVLQG